MAELDRSRITKAALEVADREGPAGFTMRAVAEELGVTPAALYRHVADKQALISLLVDAVVTEQSLPEPTGDWREDLWRMAATMRKMVHAHPGVSGLRRGQQIWTAAVLPLTERWMTLWQQSGLPLDVALRGAVVSSNAIIGIVEVESAIDKITPPPPEALTAVPSARLAFSRERDREQDFELAVRALIDGVHVRLLAEVDAAG